MSRIQRQDVKTLSDLLAQGASKSDLINDYQIYISGLDGDHTLQEAILLGLLGGHTPLYLLASEVPDSSVKVVGNLSMSPDGTSQVNGTAVPSVPFFVDSTINFQTGATTGGTFSFTLPTTTSGEYRRAVFSLLPNGTMKVNFTPAVVALGLLANPGGYFEPGSHPVGWIDLEGTGGTAYKTAGSLLNVIENSVGGESRIFNLVRAEGVASGEGTSIDPTALVRWLSGNTTLKQIVEAIDNLALLMTSGTPAADKVLVCLDSTGKNIRVSPVTIDALGNVVIPGDLLVQGTETIQNTQSLEVQEHLFYLNVGETGAGISARFGGFQVDRGTLNPYLVAFDETDDNFRTGGQSYLKGTAQAGGAVSITLAASVNQPDPTYFNGKLIHIRAGEGAGQTRYVPAVGNNWDNLTKVLVVDSAWSTVPDATSVYEILLDDLTQAVAHRENTPLNQGVAFWDSVLRRFNTHSGLVYDSVTGKLTFRALGGTGAVSLPSGSSAQRPGSPVDGDFRYNSERKEFEGRIPGEWTTLAQREEFPSNNGIVYYDSTLQKMVTSPNLLYNPSTAYVTLRGINRTDAVALPSGTTAQRPGSPSIGDLRYNSDLTEVEVRVPLAWSTLARRVTSPESNGVFYYDSLSKTLTTHSGFTYDSATGNTTVRGINRTDAFSLPSGGTGARPGTPISGDIRFNLDLGEYEVFVPSNWTTLARRVASPDANGIFYYDLANRRLATHSGFTYNPTTGYFTGRGFDRTDAVKQAVGTTAQRPGSPIVGDFRFNSDLSTFEGWDGTAWGSLGGGGTVTRVTQASHGFAVGQSLYVTVSNMALARADALLTAEVAGNVSRVLDSNTFEYTTCGLVKSIPVARFDSTPVQGDVVFLSVTTAGNFQTTDPNAGSTVGLISKPLGQVTRVGGGTADVLFNNAFRANVVGSVNVWSTPVFLTNGGTTNIQNLSGYDSVRVRAVVLINAATSRRTTVELSVTRTGDGSDYLLAVVGDDGEKQVGGDPLASWSITAAGVLQCTLPTYTSFVNASVRFTLGDTPSLGTTFPVAVSGKNLLDEKTVQVYSTSGAIPSGASGTQHLFDSASPLSMTLGSAVGIDGARLPLKNVGAGGVTITFFGSETCEGNASVSLIQWETATLMAYNGNWIIVG